MTSPSATLDVPSWIERVRTVVTLNTLTRGRLLPILFYPVRNTASLRAVSSYLCDAAIWRPSLTVFSSWIAFMGRLDDALGVHIKLLDKSVQLVLRFVEKEGQMEVRELLNGIRRDQGGIIQLTPESMDIFNAAVENSSAVRYGSIASWGPHRPDSVRLERAFAHGRTVSNTVFDSPRTRESRFENVSVSVPEATAHEKIERALGREMQDGLNDGLVPLQAWSGESFFGQERRTTRHSWPLPRRTRLDTHRLAYERAGFGEDDFGQVMDAVTDFLLDRRPES